MPLREKRTTLEAGALLRRIVKGMRIAGLVREATELAAAAATAEEERETRPPGGAAAANAESAVSVESAPTVSCLMVSRNRLALVKRSVESYLWQTHPHRELVVVRDPRAPSREIEEYIESLSRPDVVLVRPRGQPTLSALRNASLEAASGDVVCQWDDDDLGHPDRLRVQLTAMIEEGSSAVFLQDDLHHFIETGEVYWVSYREGLVPCLPGTALLRRSAVRPYLDAAAFSDRSEDTLSLARLQCPVTLVGGLPHLYVYSFHDNNTWDEAHRRGFANRFAVDAGPHEAELARELGGLGLVVSPRRGPRGAYFQVESGAPRR